MYYRFCIRLRVMLLRLRSMVSHTLRSVRTRARAQYKSIHPHVAKRAADFPGPRFYRLGKLAPQFSLSNFFLQVGTASQCVERRIHKDTYE